MIYLAPTASSLVYNYLISNPVHETKNCSDSQELLEYKESKLQKNNKYI